MQGAIGALAGGTFSTKDHYTSMNGTSSFRPRPLHLLTASPRHAYLALLAACALLVIGLVRAHCNPMGDTAATLLVSQEIARHGSVRLDGYDAQTLKSVGYAIQHKNGHAYDFFPLGTPLLSMPFVAAANLAGLDMRTDTPSMQVVIVCVVAIATLLMLFALARLFLGPTQSALMAGLCLFGTSLASNGFTTLFSHDFAALAAVCALYLVFRGTRRATPIPAAALAACLFLAYLCRPTMALLAIFVMAYLLFARRAAAVRSGAWLAGFLLVFAVWSRHEFGQWLPDYYLPKRLDGGDPRHALWQNLFGPSRGEFVYAPFLAMTIPLAAMLWRRNADYARALLIGLAWPLSHWLAVSQFPQWWGGASYGPRLMSDCLPGLFLTLFYSLHLLQRGRAAAYALLAALGAFALYVNSYQPFSAPYAALWNANPNVDEYPEYLDDWRYPQFLHDAARHTQRLAEFERLLELPADGDDAPFSGFSAPTDGIRWAGARSSIRVPLANARTLEGRLLVSARLKIRHVLAIRLNGHVIEQRERGLGDHRIDLHFDPAWLNDDDNLLDFELPDVDARERVFGFRSLSIYPKS